MKVARSGASALLALLVACGPPAANQQPRNQAPGDTDEAPWEPPDNPDDDYPLDTGFPPIENLPPDDVLFVVHSGAFTVSGSPVDGLVGTMRVQEKLNGPPPEDEPDDTGAPVEEEDDEEEDPVGCDVTYTLTGALPDQPTGCAPCDYVLDVSFDVQEGDPSDCRMPDTPAPGSHWRMGYSSSEQRIFLNYHGTSVYLPWYDAEQVSEEVTFSWSTDLGIVVEEP